MARMSAANPAAELARPAAVGKLLTETMFRGKEDRTGNLVSAVSSSTRRARREARQAFERGVSRDWGLPLRSRESGPV